jgi:hypothetical protein
MKVNYNRTASAKGRADSDPHTDLPGSRGCASCRWDCAFDPSAPRSDDYFRAEDCCKGFEHTADQSALLTIECSVRSVRWAESFSLGRI